MALLSLLGLMAATRGGVNCFQTVLKNTWLRIKLFQSIQKTNQTTKQKLKQNYNRLK